MAQMSAQSRSISIQWVLAFTSGSFKQEAKHSSQACMHFVHASIQVWNCLTLDSITAGINDPPYYIILGA
jgi:predicted short-subunit dehydrogenase-like oxidoreductase (DUF2520 family)